MSGEEEKVGLVMGAEELGEEQNPDVVVEEVKRAIPCTADRGKHKQLNMAVSMALHWWWLGWVGCVW